MNRIIVSAFIAIAAIAGNTADCDAATISKGKTKKVSTFFSKVLGGEKTVYKGTDKITPENIEATRNAVWECWRNAVANKEEEKLTAPFATNEPRDVPLHARIG